MKPSDLVEWTIQLRINQINDQPNTKHCPYGIGKVYGDDIIMIIGEVSADPTSITHIHKCWTNPEKNKASYFLHDALNYTDNPFQYYLTNAKKSWFTFENEFFLEAEISHLQPKKIIVLGNEAERMVKQFQPDLKYTKIPHPSYVRRFNKMTPREYSKLLS
jgi:hypothetical protein